MDTIRTKSMQLKEHLRDNILNQVYKPEGRIPSEQKMTRQYGVSRVTVRRAMDELEKEGIIRRGRGRGGTVVTENAAEIIRRHDQARRRNLLTVGIVLHPRMMRDSVTEKYFRLLITELRNEVRFKVFFHDYLNPEEYKSHGCALLIVEWGFPAEEVTACEKRIDLVVFARERGRNFIVADNVGAGEMAVKYLAAMGHNGIACFPLDFYESVTHFEGESRAAKELGVTLIPVRVSSMHSRDISVRMEKLVSLEHEFTAIIAPTDRDAIRIMGILERAGRAVPGDVSVLGYDDMFFSEYYATPLTTVTYPYELIALKFAVTIREFLEGGKIDVQAFIPCSIAERESVMTIGPACKDRKEA